jgi:hypothetical protein
MELDRRLPHVWAVFCQEEGLDGMQMRGREKWREGEREGGRDGGGGVRRERE